MSDSTPPEEKKIIVDEDWKSRVTAEKESANTPQADDKSPTPADSSSPEGAAQPGEYPPASFEMLISSLAAEAMMGMGQIPHPISGKPQINVAQARYSIDMLDIISQKTKGNLSDEEENAIGDLTHQLRMAFVSIQSQAAPTKPNPAD